MAQPQASNPSYPMPSLPNLVDSIVASIMCKSLSESVGQSLSLKNVGYMVLLAGVPDIKSMVVNTVYSLKAFILDRLEKLGSSETWKAVYGWMVSLVSRIARLFRSPPKPLLEDDSDTELCPISTSSYTLVLKDNFHVLDKLIHKMSLLCPTLLPPSNRLTLDGRHRTRAEYLLTPRSIALPCGLSFRLAQSLLLGFTKSKNKPFQLTSVDGAEPIPVNPLNPRPSSPKCLADLLADQEIGNFLRSDGYLNWRERTVKEIRQGKFKPFVPLSTPLQSPISWQWCRFFSSFCQRPCDLASAREIYLDLCIVAMICGMRQYIKCLDTGDVQLYDYPSTFKTTICSLDLEDWIKKTESRPEDMLIGDKTLFDRLLNSISQGNSVFTRLCEKNKEKKEKPETVETLDPQNLTLEFDLESEDLEMDLETTFYNEVIEPLHSLSTIQEPQDAPSTVSVFTTRIERSVEIVEEPNPAFEEYRARKETLENLMGQTEDKGPIASEIAKLQLPPKTVKTEIPQSKVICTEQNVVSKPISTLYLREADQQRLLTILSNFRDSKEMYTELGLRHRMGLMLHGEAGTGKSTTIVSAATFLGCDIYYVSVGNIKTNREFKMIMDHIGSKISKGGMIVMEDIDAESKLFHRRDGLGLGSTQEESLVKMVEQGDDPLNLAFMLNMFDGTLAHDDIVLVFTTNHLDRIDPAIYRPGRIDAVIHMKKCDHYQVQMICKAILGKPLDDDRLKTIEEDRWTPAELIFHLIQYRLKDEVSLDQVLAPFLGE